MITGRVVLVAPEKVGLGLTVFVQVETSDHSGTWLADFADGVTAMPEVVELYRMAGDVDYMLRVVVPDMAAYDTFYKALVSRFPLKNVTSRFAMERLKHTTALAILNLRGPERARLAGREMLPRQASGGGNAPGRCSLKRSFRLTERTPALHTEPCRDCHERSRPRDLKEQLAPRHQG